MPRGSAQLKRTRIAPVSAKRAAENRERRAVLREMFGDGSVCQRCHRAEATDPHEFVPRSAGGSITDRENIVGLCRLCHEAVHSSPEQAYAEGWLLHSWDKKPPNR